MASHHPQRPCPDCGNPRDARAARCWDCHRARVSKPSRRCLDCGIEISNIATRCKDCAGSARRRRRIRYDGYVQVFAPGHPLARRDGYVAEHRLVLHETGVAIPRGFQVHHLNGDKQDNRIENLEVVDIAEHARRHARERGTITNQYGTFPVRAALVEARG